MRLGVLVEPGNPLAVFTGPSWSRLAARKLPLDADDALVEVDRAPVQAEHLTAAQTVQQQQDERRVEQI